MSANITLSVCELPSDIGIRREPPRPPKLRNSRYEDEFDWRILFYDVYSVGEYVVFQGPPLLNLLPHLKRSNPFQGAFGFFSPQAKYVKRPRGGEVWAKASWDELVIEGALGRHAITVQPNLSEMFRGRRVLHTLSKDNRIDWIIDWISFYTRVHKADAVLFYDNNSTAYAPEDLQRTLQEKFPGVVVVVVSWPFKYGPQGGGSGSVDGKPAPWDSDFCQTGSLQHARFRFLGLAKSVLNVDIDEFVVSANQGSIFVDTELAATQLVTFPGRWISNCSDTGTVSTHRRHGDFVWRDAEDNCVCPTKWCTDPAVSNPRKQTWTVHEIVGAPRTQPSNSFAYRHFKAISNNWKYSRWEESGAGRDHLMEDRDLTTALSLAGLRPPVRGLDETD